MVSPAGSVLTVMAHPDDAELWAGGTLVVHAKPEHRSPSRYVILDITSTWTTKMHALAAHASQPITNHIAPMAETLGRLPGGRIGVR